MGTRANIVYEENQLYKSLYVSLDGYISGLGDKLINSFKKEEVDIMFSKKTNIDAISYLHREEVSKAWYLKEDNHLDAYYERLSGTDNYVINNVMVKALKKSESKSQVESFVDDIFNHANEEYVYLFSNNKWSVAAFGSKEFLSLSKLVVFSNAYESINQSYREIKEKIGVSEMDKVFCDLTENNPLQNIRKKCYLIIKKYKKQSPAEKDFIKEMLDKKAIEFKEIEKLASDYNKYLLSVSLSQKLSIKSIASVKRKI